MTLLKFDSKYVVQDSTTKVGNNTISLADDTPAVQAFSLSGTRTVLVIYSQDCDKNVGQALTGGQSAINVDGADHATTVSPVSNVGSSVPGASSSTSVWIGALGAGSHTVKGRIASNVASSYMYVTNRTLLVYIFSGDEFTYIDNATNKTNSTTNPANDAIATSTFTPSGSCQALILYNIAAYYNATEYQNGSMVLIDPGTGSGVNRVDRGAASGANKGQSAFTCKVASLTAVPITVNGQFASLSSGNTATVSARQFGILLLDPSVLVDTVIGGSQISSTSGTLADDAQASISRTTSDSRELLVIASASKYNGTSDSLDGECYGIKIDTVDVALSRQSSYSAIIACGSSVAFAQTTSAGAHTVKGRFSNNSGTTSAKIDDRYVIALWFTVPAVSTSSVGLIGAGLVGANPNAKGMIN